jgi:hypothetical protein
MKPTLLIISYSNVIRLKIALSLILRELGNINIEWVYAMRKYTCYLQG